MSRRQAVATMIAGVMIVLGLLAVFAIELSDTQARSKVDVQGRVHERSLLAAALIDSLFDTSARSSAASYSRPLSAKHVSPAFLQRLAGSNRYAVLLTPTRRVIAASTGFTAEARRDLASSATLRLLAAGQPWALGDVLPYGRGGVINYGLAIRYGAGKRYLLTGLAPDLIGPFLLGELRQIPGVKGAHSAVLDARGRVIASTNPARPTGYQFHTVDQLMVLHHAHGEMDGHYYDHVPLPHTSWSILLTAPSGSLFASVSGVRKWLPWSIFGAFAVVGLLAILLALRVLRATDAVREAKDELEVANGQLAESLAALEASNVELERQAHELGRSNAELDQFASIASHDLQEPLRKVRTFTERVTETEGAALSDRGQDYLRRAGASAERMQRLIEDLLKYSRVSTQGRPFEPVDLGQITRDVLEDLDEQVRAAEAAVRVGPLPTISADAPQMRQLVQNLISNALKFRREDIRLEVDISARTEEGWINLIVRDNGIGFEPQYANRIFRVFERLHGRGSYPGTGIGLALCLKIAQRHGGTVVARSAPGEGATFTVVMQSHRTEAVTDLSPVLPTDPNRPTAPNDSAQEPYVAA